MTVSAVVYASESGSHCHLATPGTTGGDQAGMRPTGPNDGHAWQDQGRPEFEEPIFNPCRVCARL